MNIQKDHEIKLMLNVKQIVLYQVRQEKLTLFIYLLMKEKIWKNEDKNDEFLSNFCLVKKKYGWEKNTTYDKLKRQW